MLPRENPGSPLTVQFHRPVNAAGVINAKTTDKQQEERFSGSDAFFNNN